MPCINGILCPPGLPGSADPDSPVSNYSSEAPQQIPEFPSVVFPTSWNTPGCLNLCTSTISQAAANLCALSQLAQCNPVPPGNPPINIFFSAAKTCECVSANGSSFFYTIPAGTFSASTQAQADALANAYACEQCSNPGGGPGGGGPGTPPPPGTSFVLGDLPANLCLGAIVATQIPATPSTSPVLWSVFAGALPTGLSLSSTSGIISGTASATGPFTFQIRAFNAQGNYAERTYTVCVLEISPASLAAATIGTPYSETLSATACAGLVSWTVTSGTLPPGLTLSAFTGIISGTPTGAAASYNFTVSPSVGCSKAYTVEVSGAAINQCAVAFGNLVWPAPTLFTDPAGGGAAASGTFLGNEFNAAASADTTGTDQSVATVACDGTFNYTGPEIICCMDIDFVINDVGGASSSFNIIIWHDGNLVTLFNSLSIPPYSFTIPESLVPTPILIQVSVGSNSGSGSGAASGSITVDTTIGTCI